MIQLTVDNIETYKKDFKEFFGEDFINTADEYIELTKHDRNSGKKYRHPFFEYWNSYNIDIKQTKENKKLSCSVNTCFILNLLSNIKDLNGKCNLERLKNSLLVPAQFYSAVFEVQVAALYATTYNFDIIEESLEKTPDFKINLADKKSIYIECKSLQDFEIENNEEYKKLIDLLQKYCQKRQKSVQIIISAGENFRKRHTNGIFNKIKKLINQNSFGRFNLSDLEVEISISKISDWDVPTYGNIQITHPKDAKFEIICQMRLLPNGISENKNIIMIGAEAKPILSFGNRIETEIEKAKKQIPDGSLGILHMQLPIHKGFDFERYINENYDNLVDTLKKKTGRINALIISNPMHNMKDFNPFIPNIQYYVIPNIKANHTIDSNFRYPFTSYVPNNIPDMVLSKKDSKIEMHKIVYIPKTDWNNLPPGIIVLNLVSSSGKTLFKIWKSYDKTITFDIIIEGKRMCVKSTDDPFVTNGRNSIDLIIQNDNVNIYVNKKEISIKRFV